MKKPRNKKYRPKPVIENPLGAFGGMGLAHAEHLQLIQVRRHKALADMAQGHGTRESWELLRGAINVGCVMCDQGIATEFRDELIAGRTALLEVGKRAMMTGRFVMKGQELSALTEALDCHVAQLENVRAIDVDRACREADRRVIHRINSTSVTRELAKGAP